MNWTILISTAVIGFGIAILLTFKNKPISRQSEINILQSLRTVEEIKAQKEEKQNSGLNIETLISNAQNRKKSRTADMLLQEYLHPEIQTAKTNKMKVIGGAVGFVLFMIMMVKLQGNMRILGILFPVLGYALPLFLFNAKRKAMQQTVIDAIPDLLGYLAIFLSKMSLYKTLNLILENISDEDDNILYASLRESIKEHQLGRGLEESITEKANALGVQEWISCIFTLNEGIRLGKNLQEVIQEIEDDFRNERKLKLEMEASKVTTKLSIISSTMFMPAIYTYTMVPAYLQLFKAL